MRSSYLFLALIALSACTSKEQAAADRIKAVVAAKMKDPASSTFAGLRLNHEVLCGEVNAKNSFGAYAGADQFWATATFVETRAEAASRDDALSSSPAADEWKHSAARFDKAWQECQADGVPVK